MALIKGTNSYVDLVEAEAYFVDRVDVAIWTGSNKVTDTMKEEALVTATTILEQSSWVGVVSDNNQSLAWPRSGDYYDPRLGKQARLDNLATDAPDRVKNATYELAYNLVNNDGILDSTGGVGSLSVGSIELDSIRSPDLMPATVRRFIRPLLRGGGTGWFRAN